MAGLAVSTLIFGAIRMVSGGDPDTMTKEWQEATNEYLKVRYSYFKDQKCYSKMAKLSTTGTKLRTYHGYLGRRLCRTGTRAKQTQKERLDFLKTRFVTLLLPIHEIIPRTSMSLSVLSMTYSSEYNGGHFPPSMKVECKAAEATMSFCTEQCILCYIH